MAHIRRGFFDEAQSNGTATAVEALTRIAQLYAVEAEARGKPPDERAAIRQAKAKSAFEDLVRWLQSELLKISGKSDLAKAIRYALGRSQDLLVPPRLREADAGSECRLWSVGK